MTIRPCGAHDVPAMFSVINDAARAYQGVIPADCWHEPYMPLDELEAEIGGGVVFWGCESGGELVGVMGVQDRGDVTLIRHAYVRTGQRRKGIGEKLLKHLEAITTKPILIGTWKAATWAVRFYWLVFVELPGEIRVLAIAHSRRRPGYWRSRR